MNAKSEAGFSYIDVMIAVVILMIGILAMLSALTYSVVMSKGQEKQLFAKQIAVSTMESIMSVKETDPNRLGWKSLTHYCTPAGVNCDPNGIFPTGFQNVRMNAGADEVIGTSDDTGDVIAGYQRQIAIADVCDPDRPSRAPLCNPAGTERVRIRQVTVTINYLVNNLSRQERLTTVLTDYEVDYDIPR